MSRATALTGAWLALADAAGGIEALAAAIGVDRSSIWRWHDGRPMAPAWKRLVSDYAKRRRLPDPTATDRANR